MPEPKLNSSQSDEDSDETKDSGEPQSENSTRLNLDERFNELYEESGIPEFSFVGRTAIIGETHVRHRSNPVYEGAFNSQVTRAGEIVVEFSNENDDFYARQSAFPSFMSLAETYARANNVPLTIMDDYIPPKSERLLKANLGFTEEDAYVLDILVNTHQAFLFNPENLILVFSTSLKQHNLDPNQYRWIFTAFSKEMAFLKGEIAQEAEISIQDAMVYITILNGQLKDSYYSEQMEALVKKDPNLRVLCVVGKSHRLPIANYLEKGESESKLDEGKIEQVKRYLEYLKLKYKPKPPKDLEELKRRMSSSINIEE